jgi:DHA2 family multidrug resistance protein-like MFS transporter
MRMIAGTGPRAGRRELVGLAILGLPTFLVAMDRSVLYLALPHLSVDLGASSVQQLWISDIHDFMIAGLLITMGTLGDRIGRRRLLFIGAAAFALASLLAAYSTSAEGLIAARTLVGIAGSTLMPSTMALISGMFRNRRQHTMAIAVWMGCFTTGSAFGPVIGGAWLEVFWWGSVFLVSVPIMLLLLVAGPKLLPEFRNPDAARLDLVSVGLSLAAILPVIYGLKELAREGLAPAQLLAVLVGLASGALFLARQRRLSSPLLDLKLFRSRIFSTALTLTLITGFMGGCMVFVSMYMQSVEGLSPFRTALWLLPSTLTTVLVIQLAPIIVRWVRPAYAIAAGLLLQVPGYLLLTQLDGDGNLPLLVTGLVVAAIGVSPLAALCASLTIQSAPPQKAGSAASMTETAGEFGIAMGVALLGVVGTALYRADIRIDPAVPPEAADAVRESFAGAMSTLGTLSPETAGGVVASAFPALTTSLNGVAAICAALAFGAAILAVSALRSAPPIAPDEEEETPLVSEVAAPR